MISTERLQILHEKYMELIKLEVEEFGVAPTEVRHLIGRLGEFHCALRVGGELTHRTNQHGFDVIGADKRRISVKTTAQKSGFVAISKSTYQKADDLMVIQYLDGELNVLYHGPIQRAVDAARFWEPDGNYELDLTKAVRLSGHASQTPPDGVLPSGESS